MKVSNPIGTASKSFFDLKKQSTVPSFKSHRDCFKMKNKHIGIKDTTVSNPIGTASKYYYAISSTLGGKRFKSHRDCFKISTFLHT